MRSLSVAVLFAATLAAQQVDYGAHWQAATPFDQFLSSVKVREQQWKSRFANAAVDAETLTRTRALPEKRRILVVGEDRCSDSAWAVPYLAKLAAAVPERLELRMINREKGSAIQSANPTADGKLVTPTVVVLDENDRVMGVWLERPAELKAWVASNKASMSSDELHDKIDKWQMQDGGKSTLKEILPILEKRASSGGQ